MVSFSSIEESDLSRGCEETGSSYDSSQGAGSGCHTSAPHNMVQHVLSSFLDTMGMKVLALPSVRNSQATTLT